MVPALCVLAALAADVQAEPLSFAEARARARQTYPAIQAARAGVSAARSRAGAAWAWDDPMVGTQLWNLPLSNVEGSFAPGLAARDRARTFLLGPDMVPIMVMASQTFPWPGKRAARTDEAQAQTREAEAMVDASRADVDRAVAYAYADLHAAAAATATLQDALRLLDGAITVSEGRLETSTGSLSDLLVVRTERENGNQALIDLAQQEGVARARLAALLGVSPAEVGPATEPIRMAAVPPRDVLLERALAARPELKAAHAQVAAAVARAHAERLAALPDVTVNASYMLALGGLPVAVDSGPYRALLGPSDMVTLGVSIPIPVFYPWKQARAADAALAEARRAQATADAVIRTIQSELDEALAGLQHASDHVRLHSEKLIPLSERTADTAQAEYVSGKGDVMMLLGAARMLRSHHLEYLSSETQYARHLADLERATGVELVFFGAEGEP